MTSRREWAHPADERILRHLRDNPPDYVPLVANRLGMHLGYVERRVETLVDNGFVEPISGEVIYGLTERGERHLATERIAATAGGDEQD